MVQASTSRRLTLEVFRSCEASSWTNINPNWEKKAGQMENRWKIISIFGSVFGEVCKLTLNHLWKFWRQLNQISVSSPIIGGFSMYWSLDIPFHTREPLQFSNWCRSISQSAKIALLLEGWHVGKGTLRRMDFWTPSHVLWSNHKCRY